MKRILSTALAALLVSCNLTESVKSTKTTGPKIAPRLETANGVALPVTDSVHVKVWSTAPATVWYEKTLGWSAKFVVISGVPAGTSFLLSMEGRAKQLDGTQAVWWTGTQAGTASEPQTVDAQVLTVPVTVRDIKAPTISSLPKDTILDSAVAGVRLRWSVTDDSLATVTLNGKGLTPASNFVTDSVTVSVGGSVKAILKATDKVGNVSLDTVVVSRKSTGNAVVVTNGIPWNDSIDYGSLTDSRDGKTYRTVLIGSQTWMAENLNYRNTTGSSDTVGICPDHSSDSCAVYGRMYDTRDAFMGANTLNLDYSLLSDANPSGTRGICPTGWHIPSNSEWEQLRIVAGNDSASGIALKSAASWQMNNDGSSGNGDDRFGFRALPAGVASNSSRYFARERALFVTTSPAVQSTEPVLGALLVYSNKGLSLGGPFGGNRSIRCVKNTEANLATAYGQRQLPAGTFQMGSTNGLTD